MNYHEQFVNNIQDKLGYASVDKLTETDIVQAHNAIEILRNQRDNAIIELERARKVDDLQQRLYDAEERQNLLLDLLVEMSFYATHHPQRLCSKTSSVDCECGYESLKGEIDAFLDSQKRSLSS